MSVCNKCWIHTLRGRGKYHCACALWKLMTAECKISHRKRECSILCGEHRWCDGQLNEIMRHTAGTVTVYCLLTNISCLLKEVEAWVTPKKAERTIVGMPVDLGRDPMLDRLVNWVKNKACFCRSPNTSLTDSQTHLDDARNGKSVEKCRTVKKVGPVWMEFYAVGDFLQPPSSGHRGYCILRHSRIGCCSEHSLWRRNDESGVKILSVLLIVPQWYHKAQTVFFSCTPWPHTDMLTFCVCTLCDEHLSSPTVHVTKWSSWRVWIHQRQGLRVF